MVFWLANVYLNYSILLYQHRRKYLFQKLIHPRISNSLNGHLLQLNARQGNFPRNARTILIKGQ